MLLLRAGVAHHIGNIYSDIDPSQAMPYLEEARDIFWKLLSPTHPDTLDVLNSVCSLRLTLEDDYDDILAGLQKLLELFIKAYGPMTQIPARFITTSDCAITTCSAPMKPSKTTRRPFRSIP